MATATKPRPLTNDEYAKLTPQQRVALGLDEDEGGAPADFSGTVLPNPNHLRLYADTESGIDPTRLSDGASFHRDLATGDMPRDVSNPPAAQLLPSEMQTVGAKMSAVPIDYDALAQKHGAVAAAVDYDALAAKHGATGSSSQAQPSVWDVLTQPTDKTDAEAMSYKGAAGVAGATIKGLDDVARGTESAISGAWDTIRHPIDAAKGIAALPSQAAQVPSAIHDINAGPAPAERYLDEVAQPTVSQGAGQALTALGAAGIAKVPGAVGQIADRIPSAERAGEAFQAVSKVVGKHTVAVTPGLSDSLMQYQQLVDAGGSRSLAVSKLMNRLTSPNAAPLTYEEARLFQSNISRLSADEFQRLTPVMQRQVGQISSELNKAVQTTAADAGQLDKFQGAMQEYAAAKSLQAKMDVLKKYGMKAAAYAARGGLAAAGAKAVYDMSQK